jgi:hypothetical protein
MTEKLINRRPLTKAQMQHAERRLQEAQQRQLAALSEKHKAPEEPKTPRLNDAQFYRGIATGKLKLRPLDDITRLAHQRYWNGPMDALRDAFAAPVDMTKKKAHDAAVKAHDEIIAKGAKQIDIRFQNALDALYLADADKAMAIIEAFAAGK